MKIIRTLLLFMLSNFVGFVSIPVLFFLFDFSFIDSLLIGIGIPAFTLVLMVTRFLWKRLRNVDPYKEELAYVKHQVKEANKKVTAIGNNRYKVRSLQAWTKISKLHKLAKGLVKIVEEEPSRYQDVQPFFTQHLPAAVTLVDRYTFLMRQPVRSMELNESLRETEQLMDEMASSYEQVLLHSLSKDVLSLEIERKMFQQSFEYEQAHSTNSSETVHHKDV